VYQEARGLERPLARKRSSDSGKGEPLRPDAAAEEGVAGLPPLPGGDDERGDEQALARERVRHVAADVPLEVQGRLGGDDEQVDVGILPVLPTRDGAESRIRPIRGPYVSLRWRANRSAMSRRLVMSGVRIRRMRY